ncbi:MAG: HAMP domain-containing histidine kinase [Symploca sp. SIO1C2]|nr:HAMP domain-containing histidine kinase [Symploca sp. SIO1C2]NER47782.1 HAMP domain-containing histidine kinase [Symploca sp. SIO1A3]
MNKLNKKRYLKLDSYLNRTTNLKFPSHLLPKVGQFCSNLNPRSLRARLTVGIAVVAAVGMGSLAIWISWKMQDILVVNHKQNIKYIDQRLPQEVEIYSDMMSVEEGMQKAINNLTINNTLLWIRDTDGFVAAQSAELKASRELKYLKSLSDMPLTPKVSEVKGGYWILCGSPLMVSGEKMGTLYIAQDITEDQVMFMSMIRSLGIASLLTIGGLTVAIAFYIQRSLQPLQRMGQLTKNISADDLGEAHIHLDNAPSELKELAQTFDEMLVRLHESWEQQRQFVSNVSHELRTPLTVVSGYLQSTLRRGSNLTQPQREALEIAGSEADRTIQLLQDLLDLARVDSGHLHFNLEPLVLNELVQEIAEMARQYSNREIQVESPNSEIEVKADTNRLKQVLLNLIDNAVKYSDSGQPVTLKLDSAGGWGRIQVCDRGNGIPLQHQARIFERFYRVDDARARSTGGCGLGLSIVQTLVEGMGGRVTVRSQLGKGSVFSVTLPIN